ncbi:hexameric tyrosine-coordinated heme protein [Nonomuraea lactucae]|uniref:hexameric tyrosine-coordinated heme protein n=1 Tax=Nonomuraea lactucae TaxID=2249762 RepID=UPI00196256C3|nr:hexameric tyrosine-coordinated heme protein [Nonomuraea lactucae]
MPGQTVAEWGTLLEAHGFVVEHIDTTTMALLEPRRMSADEGLRGAARFGKNLTAAGALLEEHFMELVPGNTLLTATPDEGRALAVKLARATVKATQPDADVRQRLRPDYAEDPAALIAVGTSGHWMAWR